MVDARNEARRIEAAGRDSQRPASVSRREGAIAAAAMKIEIYKVKPKFISLIFLEKKVKMHVGV